MTSGASSVPDVGSTTRGEAATSRVDRTIFDTFTLDVVRGDLRAERAAAARAPARGRRAGVRGARAQLRRPDARDGAALPSGRGGRARRRAGRISLRVPRGPPLRGQRAAVDVAAPDRREREPHEAAHAPT